MSTRPLALVFAALLVGFAPQALAAPRARFDSSPTRIRALEGQARLLLNDLNEFETCSAWGDERTGAPDDAAERWLRDVYRPTLARIAATVGPDRDLIQAYCDVLEEKWLLSEAAGHDVGLDAALPAYLELGAPAPEDATTDPIALDIDWSTGFDDGPAGT